ncbi:ZIP family metal transporter [Mucilaginibacter ginsenosidivorans]|uniref:Zinc/iron permease n=1 Tax=Mucilaginibacter ginsenosidivorans TaxID=398053 RepID=A0A5B8V114_9SPHI|nr:ZIP family metal transporter [Mucilaginibacter ginsenosidivorans]QEC64878.1 zinc/iron permease [Mucilaginibacter ginsenosidivorans]
MDTWKIIVLFLGAFTGGMSVFFFKGDNHKTLKLVLSFSGAFLFGITVLHLIPDAYHGNDNYVGVFILIGFLFQIFLEQLSEGIEHGHIHKPGPEHFAFPLGILVSLCIHAFLEGMPLAEGNQNQLVYGIALHHVPAAFALGTVLLANKQGKNKTIFFIVLFAIMAPAGYFFSNELSAGGIGNLQKYYGRIMGVVIGIFLHISTTILFESSSDHKFTVRKMIAVLLGMGIALGAFFAEL